MIPTPTIQTFERIVRAAVAEDAYLLDTLKRKNIVFNVEYNAKIWFFPDWQHIEISTYLYTLFLYPTGEYFIDYTESSPYTTEDEGHIHEHSILNILLSLV